MAQRTVFAPGTTIASEWLNRVDATIIVATTPEQFGAVGDGVTDDTAPMQAAINAAAGGRCTLSSRYAITAPLRVPSLTTIELRGGAVVRALVPNISQFAVIDVQRVSVIGEGTIESAVPGTTAYYAGVYFSGASDCRVSGLTFVGMQWAGVCLDRSSSCTIENNTFIDARGGVQDAADIMVFRASSHNMIRGNRCRSGSHTGIMVQDPYEGLVPRNNQITGNIVSSHTAYGIAVYIPGPPGTVGDSDNQIIGNRVDDIKGSFPTNPSSGAGIYVVGAHAGGTQVIGNRVTACCQQTQGRSLTPAGIGVNSIAAAATPPVIANNTITDLAQGDGILIASSPGGALINGNVVRVPATNNGSGLGGGSLVGAGIRIENSDRVCVGPNNVVVNGAGSAFFVYANGVNVRELAIQGGTYEAADSAAVRVDRSGAEVATYDLQLNQVRATIRGASNYAVSLVGVHGATLQGVVAIAVGFEALRLVDCRETIITGGRATSTSAAAFSSSGACQGSLLESNLVLGPSAVSVQNAGAGCAVERRADAAPTTGVWQAGDRIINRVVVAGAPKGWRCVASGAPGTWVSEGNL